MASKDKNKIKTQPVQQGIPFQSAEEAWFWFMAAQEAKNDGARVGAGNSLFPRPCEPVDILNILDRLYRQRRLLRDHFLILKHYGQRRMPPDPDRIKEIRAHRLWNEALERIGKILEDKGIVRPSHFEVNLLWHKEAFVFEGGLHQ